MERRRVLAMILPVLSLCLVIIVCTLTPYGTQFLYTVGLFRPTPTRTSPPPTPTPTPRPILTVRGTPPLLAAEAAYLIDMDTDHTLADVNGEKPLPMASTTKIMTALIALQTGNLDQAITITQAELDQVPPDASSANLVAGDTLTLRTLLYGLMLPSGDDAALVIADALGGTTNNFVQRMNLFAYRLHLFQTHYTNPHGLNLASDHEHYTSAADLVRLTHYALSIPLFTQIVQTQSYHLPATNQHHSYTWTNTNTLLSSYQGMIGVKTGHTDAAGYCLVFAAIHNGHYLLGVVLNSTGEIQRNRDVTALLNWGFALPVLPPS